MVCQTRKRYFLNLDSLSTPLRDKNRKVKGISPFAFQRNFLVPSLTSFSHLATYDFHGVEPAPSSDWPPWSAACDGWHARSPVLFILPSGSLSQATLQFLCSLVLNMFHREEEGVTSPRLVGDTLLLPLAQPGFLMAPAVTG